MLAQLTAQQRSTATLVGGTALAWLLGSLLLPAGVEPGVVLQGVTLGGLQALTAMGIVLIYRSSRAINFAQAEIGGLAASVAVLLVVNGRLPYVVGVVVGLVVAVLTGALVERTVVRRFASAPRLILMVATLGVVQLVGAAEVFLPQQFGSGQDFSTFTTPFHFTFRLHPLVFTGDHLLALVVTGGVLAGLATFLGRTKVGIAVRAAADSNERALLLGIPVQRLSLITWVVAAGLSGLTSILSAPILGPNLGAFAGPRVLLLPLAAAVLAQMESLPKAVAASVGLSVVQQVVFASYLRSSAVDVVFFVVVMAGLLLQRRKVSRVDDGGLGGFVAIGAVRPVPAALAALPEVRRARLGLGVAVAAVLLVAPQVLSTPNTTLLGYMAVYGMIAVSLVVLIGWAGQISLGQFAFVGIGAGAAGGLMANRGTDLFVALLAAAIVGAVVATLLGIPALRIPGPFLAVATLAFAVPVSTFVLNATYFPWLTPNDVPRPPILQRFDMARPAVFAYTCIAGCGLVVLLARAFRASRPGRAVVAVRDNERGAAAFSINPVRTKLTAFAFSGAISGIAGGLYVVGLQGVGYNSFPLTSSIVVFSMVVVGGLGSIPGALLGAVYVVGAQYYLHGALQLVATGAGLLVLLLLLPGGLGAVLTKARDALLRVVADRHGLPGPGVIVTPTSREVDAHGQAEDAPLLDAGSTEHLHVAPASLGAAAPPAEGALVSCRGIDAGYGSVQILFDVDLDVRPTETVALLGTNGAGKSTVLKVIAGLLDPTRGVVTWEGQDITRWSPAARVKAGIATVPGGRGVFGSLTVAENLRVATWLTGDDQAFVDQTMAQVLEWFPRLQERWDVKASLLSGGEQQMLAISQSMLCRPRLLIIDELSLGLAPSVVGLLLDAVRRLNEAGITVIVVEQSINVATELARRAVFMEKGEVRFSGATAELVDRPDLLRAVFLRSGTADGAAAGAAGGSGGAFLPLESEEKDASKGLRATDLRIAFGGVTAVDGVSFEVAPGEVLGIIGSNGAGKTTLFDLCSGFLKPDTGSLVLTGASGDRDLTHLGPDLRAAVGLGRVFQDARLFPSMTVAECIAVALERHIEVREPLACTFRVGAAVDSEREVRARVDELIGLLQLDRWRDAFVSELSTGTRRMVELACTLAHEPSVLLLDEPSSGIAQRETEALAGVLLDIRRHLGAALLIIEHDIPMVSGIADRLLCLHLGAVIAEGEPGAVLRDPAVVSSYLGTSEVAINRSGAVPAAPVPRRRRAPLVAVGRRTSS